MPHPSPVTGLEEITEVSRSAVKSPAIVGVPRLILLSGPQAGRKFPVGAEMTLGRGSQATLFLDDKRLSRIHARIFQSGTGYAIEDLRSLNGSFVNGQRITAQPLMFGDKIQLGSIALLFTHDNPHDEQLAQVQKMELLGRIGAGIAHDFNNLLGVAVASMDYLATLPANRTMGDADVRECHDDVRAALKRAADLTMRLLGVARRGGYMMGRIDVGALATEVAELVRRVTSQNVHIACSVIADAQVIGDQGQIHQALMNLCINARDAMPSGGELKITVARETSPANMGVALGDVVVISVSDTGTGMDENTRRRAFESFFTTKEGDKGTGLGLATVLETVKVHGGHIDLISQLGRGTTLRLLFPAAPRVERSRVGADTLMDLPTRTSQRLEGTARILLVDDDPGVRRSLSRLLAMQGHEVEQAANGQLAVDAYRQLRPDLVLMDLDMPVLGGRKAYEALVAIDPAVKVIFMSGHGVAGALGGPPPGCTFLQKPCGVDDLRAAIEGSLMA